MRKIWFVVVCLALVGLLPATAWAVSAPTVTAVSPVSGSVAGGTVVTVTGTNLLGATAVKFGGVAGTAVTVASATEVKATTPAHAVGAVDVQVTTGGGTSTAVTADKFTYTTPPLATYPSVVLSDKPSVYFRLGEKSGSTAFDSSGHGNNGIYTPGTAPAGGAIAGDSDGSVTATTATTSSVTGSADGLPTGGNPRTMEVWFKSSDATDAVPLSYGSARGTSIVLAASGGSDIHFGTDGGQVAANAPFDWSDNSWHLIDVTFAGGVGSIYIDGHLLVAGAMTANTTADSGLVVGGNRQATPVASYDEAAIYPTALAASRITAHWSRGQSALRTCGAVPATPYGLAVKADNPAVYYRLGDRGASRVAFDSSGNCRNGAFLPVTTPAGGAIAGDSDGSVHEVNSPSMIGSTDGLPTGSSARTLEIWIKADNATDARPLGYGSSGSGNYI